MKLLFSALVAAALVACLTEPGAAAAQAGEQVYTWVDQDGVRHYSDHPGNPGARLIDINAVHPGGQNETTGAAAPATAGAASGEPSAAAPPRSTSKPAMTRAQRTALCAKLRDRVQRLEPARRVKVTKNGKVHYYSGENLVEFRARTQKKMQRVCAPLNE